MRIVIDFVANFEVGLSNHREDYAVFKGEASSYHPSKNRPETCPILIILLFSKYLRFSSTSITVFIGFWLFAALWFVEGLFFYQSPIVTPLVVFVYLTWTLAFTIFFYFTFCPYSFSKIWSFKK